MQTSFSPSNIKHINNYSHRIFGSYRLFYFNVCLRQLSFSRSLCFCPSILYFYRCVYSSDRSFGTRLQFLTILIVILHSATHTMQLMMINIQHHLFECSTRAHSIRAIFIRMMAVRCKCSPMLFICIYVLSQLCVYL